MAKVNMSQVEEMMMDEVVDTTPVVETISTEVEVPNIELGCLADDTDDVISDSEFEDADETAPISELIKSEEPVTEPEIVEEKSVEAIVEVEPAPVAKKRGRPAKAKVETPVVEIEADTEVPVTEVIEEVTQTKNTVVEVNPILDKAETIEHVLGEPEVEIAETNLCEEEPMEMVSEKVKAPKKPKLSKAEKLQIRAEKKAQKVAIAEQKKADRIMMKELKAEKEELDFQKSLTNYSLGQHVLDTFIEGSNKVIIGLNKAIVKLDEMEHANNEKKIKGLHERNAKLENETASMIRENSVLEDRNVKLNDKWIIYNQELAAKREAEAKVKAVTIIAK